MFSTYPRLLNFDSSEDSDACRRDFLLSRLKVLFDGFYRRWINATGYKLNFILNGKSKNFQNLILTYDEEMRSPFSKQNKSY